MAKKDSKDSLAHYKNCGCVYCTKGWLASEFITYDEIGPALLDQYIAHLAKLKPKGTPKKLNHWASATDYSCLRKEWLRHHEAESTNPDDYNPDIFALGTSIEEDLVEKYLRSGNCIDTQEYVEVKDPRLHLSITGKVDLLISEGEEIVPVEIKSVKDWGYNTAWRKMLPRTEHIAQLTMYLKALKLPRGYIEYVNKNKSIRARYEVRFSERFYDEVVEKLMVLESELPKMEPPIPKDMEKGKFPCSWGTEEEGGKCAFFDHCYLEAPVTLKIEEIRW